LSTDLRFRYQCEFSLDREAPSIATLSRVFADITKKELAKRLFEDLASHFREEGILDGFSEPPPYVDPHERWCEKTGADRPSCSIT